ncbi:hypothetical protein OPQ81_002726 [Rhizoctonia solani]|nr:hypothetical protein OPQ81_002726 [Rhizoctonia solani]
MRKGHRQLNVPEDEYESETYEHALVHGLKRAHTNTSEQGPLKKRVKGKQGGLQGIMKMPIEVFMEIAPYVNPGDLITLIRTNKFFRAMLLNRTARNEQAGSIFTSATVPSLSRYRIGGIIGSFLCHVRKLRPLHFAYQEA